MSTTFETAVTSTPTPTPTQIPTSSSDTKSPSDDSPEIFQVGQGLITSYSTERKRGTCKWYDVTKGYGFILPSNGGGDVFVHQTAIQMQGFRSLVQGEEVDYEFYIDEKGRRRANNVTGPEGRLLLAALRTLYSMQQFYQPPPPTSFQFSPFPVPAPLFPQMPITAAPTIQFNSHPQIQSDYQYKPNPAPPPPPPPPDSYGVDDLTAAMDSMHTSVVQQKHIQIKRTKRCKNCKRQLHEDNFSSEEWNKNRRKGRLCRKCLGFVPCSNVVNSIPKSLPNSIFEHKEESPPQCRVCATQKLNKQCSGPTHHGPCERCLRVLPKYPENGPCDFAPDYSYIQNPNSPIISPMPPSPVSFKPSLTKPTRIPNPHKPLPPASCDTSKPKPQPSPIANCRPYSHDKQPSVDEVQLERLRIAEDRAQQKAKKIEEAETQIVVEELRRKDAEEKAKQKTKQIEKAEEELKREQDALLKTKNSHKSYQSRTKVAIDGLKDEVKDKEELKNKLKEAQRLLEEQQDQHSCCICQTAKKEIMFEPCHHLCTCVACAQKLEPRICPICRCRIQKDIKVFT